MKKGQIAMHDSQLIKGSVIEYKIDAWFKGKFVRSFIKVNLI